jgi:hypothetical protein
VRRARLGRRRFAPAPGPHAIGAARRLLGLGVPALARAAALPVCAVRRAERGGPAGVRQRLAAVLEARGIEFLADGVAVRPRRMRRTALPKWRVGG